MAAKPRTQTSSTGFQFRILGASSTPLRDFYHALLRLPWAVSLGTIAAGYLAANGVFALVYMTVGGVANARPGSLRDAFFFSVQTMGTIGYGAMYPESSAAQAVVVAESITGLIVTALATGLVFAKFSRPTARVVFTRDAVISPHEGVPTLSLRIGNERGNSIVEAHVRATLTLTETTLEGKQLYRFHDLRLSRERVPSLRRSFTLFHPIDAASPLHGRTAEELSARDAEIQVMVIGFDDTTMQTVHASHEYSHSHVLWGMRHADVLSETEDGVVILDLGKFHDVEPVDAK